MLTLIRSASMAALLALVSGCMSTGGTLGGLFPMPKVLKGSIVNNVYLAKDAAFRVASPQDAGSYEYKYMAVKETYDAGLAYVSFGPAAFDQSIYRVNVTGTINETGVAQPFETVAVQATAAFRAELEKSLGTPLEETDKGTSVVNGRNALSWTYIQSVPSRTRVQGSSAADTLIHNVMAIDGGNLMALLWVQTPASCHECDGKAVKFVSSFEFAK